MNTSSCLLKKTHKFALPVLQVRVSAEGRVPGLMPTHLLLKLSSAETPIMPSDLQPLRLGLSAPLWEVCAQPHGLCSQ